MQFDPLSDAFTQIFNAEQAGHYEVTVNPASKMLGSMLSIMQTSGYVGEYERIDNGRGGAYRIELIGAINRCGVIKPRHSVKRAEFDKWESRYLPARDFGLLILTTNQGVMNHYDAKKERVGGRLLAYIF
ncbi:MAG: 30S ribosomal protein S8 [Candidatus Thalassarchaeum betae]|uniref:Small ribosomal subunit protein uS8 n=1 Tax=Candidatus Thalassarchaeum betae TaxID=2599289 RepID=A0A2V3HPV1_9ARCH|nr:MAG: 30S ribosomal protein S8 [Candidatus Thalassoarchaea betae]PXF26220.1 MAG: 30S ribosomal protein S8 [Euryarchaeota archaeon]HIM13508.1 30S ribosomal protein S8 [Candidatus Poseidoniales archaeon]HIM92350.1 30S ribosomal protein S8 [Candidatus Poseidoniales archaeon]